MINIEPIENALLNALAKPNELSGHSYPDGTPMTNFEYYKNIWNNPAK